MDGRAVDVKRTRFGFREWSISGNKLLLNGVPMHLRSDTVGEGDLKYQTPDQVLAKWRSHGQTMFDFYHPTGWAGMRPEKALDWFDANGIPVMRTASSMLRVGDYFNFGHPGLMEVVEAQWAARVKAERNHPSVFLWTLDHFTYFDRGPKDTWGLAEIESRYRAGAAAVRKLDPTRPVTVLGCDALSDNSLPVTAHEFNQDATNIREFPDEAYTFKSALVPNKTLPFHFDLSSRPVLLAEEQFPYGYADGRFKIHNPDDDKRTRMWPYQTGYSWVPRNVSWIPERFAAIGGDAVNASQGHWTSLPAETTLARILTEGERWLGLSAVRYDFARSRVQDHYLDWSPVAAFVREWNWTFAGGRSAPRHIRLFNDTHDAAPITCSWQLSWPNFPGAKAVPTQSGKKTLKVPAGGFADVNLALKLPASPVRRIGELRLSCERNGKPVFQDTKRVDILANAATPKPALAGDELAVWDPSGQAAQRLNSRAIPFTAVKGIEKLPDGIKVLLVGSNAVSDEQATSSAWQALVSRGVRVIVLDQDHPLQGASAPSDLTPTSRSGQVAFALSADHPVFAGLQDRDFFTWTGDHNVYRNIYKKPTYGAQCLAQADAILAFTPLVQVWAGDGLLLLSQFALNGKLNSDPVAGRLFDNLLNYAAAWQAPASKPAALAFGAGNPHPALLARLGLQSQTATDPLDALAKAGSGIAVVEGSPANLEALAAHQQQVKQFTDAGGWLVLCGVTPDGLQSFNQLTGVDQIMRPYGLGTYGLGQGAKDPFMAGLSQSDVRLTSDLLMDLTYQGYTKVYLPSPTAFNYVVDLDDMTQFLKLPPPSYWGYTATAPHTSGAMGGASGSASNHWPGNLANGLLSSDWWCYAFAIEKNKGAVTSWPMELPRPEKINGFALDSEIYCHPTRVTLTFDGDKSNPEVLTMPPGGGYHSFSFAPHTAKTITMSIDTWDNAFDPGVIGVDEIWLTVDRDQAFQDKVKPLLSVGGLVKYPQGKGGIVLDQLRASDEDLTLESVRKRDNLLRTLLQNMGANFNEMPLRVELEP